MRITTTLGILFVLLFSLVAAADEIVVAAASDLNFALKDIASNFQRETGHKVNLTFGSSGNFFSAIQNGAPYDVYFSADIDYPRKLEAAGLAVPGAVYEYASGKLVIWVPQNSPLDLKQGMSVLLDSRVKKIAIANPAHAPYGRAAVAAMQSAGGYDRVKGKLVTGENISQAAQFVQTGNADVGLVALSLALSPTMKSAGRFVEVPAASYPPIRQAAIVLKSSKKQTLARQFLEYMKKPQSLEILRLYGFVVSAEERK